MKGGGEGRRRGKKRGGEERKEGERERKKEGLDHPNKKLVTGLRLTDCCLYWIHTTTSTERRPSRCSRGSTSSSPFSPWLFAELQAVKYLIALPPMISLTILENSPIRVHWRRLQRK